MKTRGETKKEHKNAIFSHVNGISFLLSGFCSPVLMLIMTHFRLI